MVDRELAETAQNPLGFLELALGHKIPGSLRAEEDQDAEGDSGEDLNDDRELPLEFARSDAVEARN